MSERLPTAEQARKYMNVTANPLATEAGRRELQRGGTAVDAMIAAQAGIVASKLLIYTQ